MGQETQVDLLNSLELGNLIESGKLFKGLAPKESICWMVVDKVVSEKVTKVTFDLSFFGAHLGTMEAHVTDTLIRWSGDLSDVRFER